MGVESCVFKLSAIDQYNAIKIHAKIIRYTCHSMFKSIYMYNLFLQPFVKSFNTDRELLATAVLEDKDILEMVKDDDKEDEIGDSVDNSVEAAPPPTLCEARNALLTVMRYMETNGHATEQDITNINNLHSHIDSLVSLFSKQTNSTTFEKYKLCKAEYKLQVVIYNFVSSF